MPWQPLFESCVALYQFRAKEQKDATDQPSSNRHGKHLVCKTFPGWRLLTDKSTKDLWKKLVDMLWEFQILLFDLYNPKVNSFFFFFFLIRPKATNQNHDSSHHRGTEAAWTHTTDTPHLITQTVHFHLVSFVHQPTYFYTVQQRSGNIHDAGLLAAPWWQQMS